MKNEVDLYIQGFPKSTQRLLEQIRQLVQKAVPDAEERISYAIPTFMWKKKPLLYFAAYKHHISCYPAPVDVDEFQQDFAAYKTSKGTIQFPLDQSLPLTLIKKIVAYRKSLIESSKKQPSLRRCKHGHEYYKSSDCPSCPICEKQAGKANDFLPELSAPARRALAAAGISNLQSLSKMSEEEVLTLHGIGKTSIPKMQKALAQKGLKFKA